MMDKYRVVDNENDIEEVETVKPEHNLKCYVDGGYSHVNERGHYCFIIGSERHYGKVNITDFFNVTGIYDEIYFTSNAIEYYAVIMLIKKLPENTKAVIHSDSSLIVKQLSGDWKIKYEHLKIMSEQIHELLRKKSIDAEFKWIPRGDNKAGVYLEKCFI
jgi:ribonuclease HI